MFAGLGCFRLGWQREGNKRLERKAKTHVHICSWSDFWEVFGQQLCEEEGLDAVEINSLLRMLPV